MSTIATDLYLRIWGAGHAERVVLLHGANVPDPERTWQAQRPLAEEYELIVLDRRGFGHSPTAERITWESQVADLFPLVGERAHLVGHSYGAILALLFASQYPASVSSLTAIEPPAFGLALDDPAVAALAARLAPVHNAAPDLTPEEFLRRFVAAQGEEAPVDFVLAPAHRKAVDATRRAPDPTTAPLEVERLATTRYPKLVASGEWTPEMETICDRVATLIGAERAVFPGGRHSPQQLGAPFNERLRSVFVAADAP
jgi:pimeloyl-ACP methyl ester carboxylesterase